VNQSDSNGKQLALFNSAAITDQERQQIQSLRDIAQLPDDQLIQFIRRQALQQTELVGATNSGVNGLIQVFMLLTAISAAVTVGPDTRLAVFLAEYPAKLSVALTNSILANDQLQAIAKSQPFKLQDGADLSELPTLVGKYAEGIRVLLMTGNGDKLRAIVQDKNKDFTKLLTMINRQGRPPGLEPFQRKIAELAIRFAESDERLTYRQIADKMLTYLANVKRAREDDEIISWLLKLDRSATKLGNLVRKYREEQLDYS
jgi:hypothetical protein